MSTDYARSVYQRMIAIGLTQAELARRAGIERDQVSAIVRGTSSDSAVKEKIEAVLQPAQPTPSNE